MQLKIMNKNIEFELSKGNDDVILGINIRNSKDDLDDTMVISLFLTYEEFGQLEEMLGVGKK